MLANTKRNRNIIRCIGTLSALGIYPSIMYMIMQFNQVTEPSTSNLLYALPIGFTLIIFMTCLYLIDSLTSQQKAEAKTKALMTRLKSEGQTITVQEGDSTISWTFIGIEQLSEEQKKEIVQHWTQKHENKEQ
ncbi:MAG: hypothetical protein AAF378_25315 [Cyanobacteria bacterium P01_A01_bin.84]